MKIKEEQLNEIKQIQAELNQTLTDIGYIESQKHALLHKIKTINERDAETASRGHWHKLHRDPSPGHWYHRGVRELGC